MPILIFLFAMYERVLTKVLFPTCMTFTDEQAAQVTRQLSGHDRGDVEASIQLDETTSLDLLVQRGVFGSDVVSGAIYLARFLYQHSDLYRGMKTLDMGCGPGTQGLVMGINGASHVTFADINPKSVENAQINADHYGTGFRAVESDLFSNLEDKYQAIVFNHPFFPGDPETFSNPLDDVMLYRSMLGGTELLPRFFSQVREHWDPKGPLVIPYWDFAGPENDPANHVANYDLRIDKCHEFASEEGLQRGPFKVYEIRLG